VPARRGAIAQAIQDFQGKCCIEQHHPDGNVRKKLNTLGNAEAEAISKSSLAVYRVHVAREDARSHPSFSLGFFPIGKFKKFNRGWRKKVPWLTYLCTHTGWMTEARVEISVGNHGCSNITGKSTGRANCPLGRVAVSSCCSHLASAPPWEHHPPLIR
jgi:hypothetical protein